MKFPSIVRLQRNKKFHLEPRYYDPIKEEIRERTERIRKELQGGTSEHVPGRITFERRAGKIPATSLLQVGIAAILGLLLFGWIFIGNDIFYALFGFIPVYLFIRFRNRRK